MLSLKLIKGSMLSACRCASIANRSLHLNIRNLSEEKPEKIHPMQELEENFNPIYRFPKIRLASAVCKVKNIQAIITAISVPLTYFTVPEYFFPVFYTGCSFLVALSLASLITQNAIGAAYVNKKNQNLVRIAYIDFFGLRRDSEFKIEDIVPLYESKKFLGIATLKFNNNHKSLKFISTQAVILDEMEFSRVFGE